MHVKFDPSSVNLDTFYHSTQFGGSYDGPYQYFRGIPPYQRGYGIRQRGAGVSDILRSVWRFLLPMIKKAGTEVGKEALSTGARVLTQMNESGNISKPEIINEIKKGVDNVYERGGMKRQFGTGKRIKGAKRPKYSVLIGKKVKAKNIRKNKNRDIFSHGLF